MSMIWSTVPEQNKLNLVILGHFYPLSPLRTPKIKILKSEKICWRYHHFTYVHQKSQSCDVWFLRYWLRQTKFLFFLPFYPLWTQKITIFKKIGKNTRRYYYFTSIWCMAPQIWSATDRIFCHFGPFSVLNPEYIWGYHLLVLL